MISWKGLVGWWAAGRSVRVGIDSPSSKRSARRGHYEMDRDQRLIEREAILARTRFLRELASETREEADVTRWHAEQERGYSGYLRGAAAGLRRRASRVIDDLEPTDPSPS